MKLARWREWKVWAYSFGRKQIDTFLTLVTSKFPKRETLFRKLFFSKLSTIQASRLVLWIDSPFVSMPRKICLQIAPNNKFSRNSNYQNKEKVKNKHEKVEIMLVEKVSHKNVYTRTTLYQMIIWHRYVQWILLH